ncbi:WXG100 family type VII secretion target [Corynebacterium cystitidis]|uniref:WXG100 family type VII secretion target n=1 Tax=Corynebacterium cystitidis TaxID=35757 RepID=UPI00211DEAAE|nr:WXG100 family type VII secretion target [Corynebacterium cystitidis]
MARFYSFTTSTGDTSAQAILNVQSDIRSTLDTLERQVHTLAAQWLGSESEEYQDLIRKWNSGAEGIRSQLTIVVSGLNQFSDGNTELRTSIGSRIGSMR